MWVITGPFDNSSERKTKLLKPGRTYPLGRKLKEPLQLVINNPKVSGDHAIITVGEHSVGDVTEVSKRPTLTYHNLRNKLCQLARGEDRLIINPSSQEELQDGDAIGLLVGVIVNVSWKEVCCYWVPPRDQENISTEKCASLGLKITPLPLPEVSHHCTSEFSLSIPICISLLSSAHLVNPEWLHEILDLGATPQDTTSPDGPSKLEYDFQLPKESQFTPAFDPTLPSALKNCKKWCIDVKREDMFKGWRFLFVGEKGRETSSQIKQLVDRGGGAYEIFDVASGKMRFQQAITKLKRKVVNDDGNGLCIVADESSMRAAIGDKWDELVEILRVSELRFLSQDKILEAVGRINTTYLDSSKGVPSEEPASESFPDFIQNTYPEEPSQLPESNTELEARQTRSGRTLRRRVTPQSSSRPPSRAPSRAPSQAPEPPPVPKVKEAQAAAVDTATTTEDQSARPRRNLIRRAKTTVGSTIEEADEASVAQVEITLAESTMPLPPPPAHVESDTQTSKAGRSSRLKRRAGTTADVFLSDVTKAIEETQSKEQPALKKFRALFEASDPDRIDSQMPMSIDATMDDESMTLPDVSREVSRPAALAEVLEEQEETQSQAPEVINNVTKRKADTLADDETLKKDTRPTKRRALEDSRQAKQVELPVQTQKEAAPTSIIQQATQHKKAGGTGAAPGKPDQDAKFLKALASKKKGKKSEDEFDREFNNLRISKPDIQQDNDLAQEDYEVLADFGDDGDLRGNFMVVMEMDVPEKERRGIRRGDERIDWEGRVDYKKFKHKDKARGRVIVELFVDDQADYGMGSAYWKANSQSQGDEQAFGRNLSSKSRPKSQATQKASTHGLRVINSDESDEFEAEPEPTAKGRRRATSKQPVSQSQKRTKTQTRGRTRRNDTQLFLDSEEENETIDIPGEDGDDAEMVDVDDVVTIRSSAETREEPAPLARQGRKKRAPAPILDDDSDTGVTFKGFDSRKRRKL